MKKPKKRKSELRTLIENTLQKYVVPLNCKKVLNAGDNTDKYKKYFDGEYTTLDKREGADIQADLHDLSQVRKKFDLIICVSVLEHVEFPFLVMQELKMLLKPGGYLFISVPFFYKYHHGGGYEDYWRFTEKGMDVLVGLEKVLGTSAKKSSGFCGLYQSEKKAVKIDYEEDMEVIQG